MLCTTLRADLTRGLMDCLCKALGISTVQVYSDALVEKNLGLAPGHTEQQRCVRMRACACVCVRACVLVLEYVGVDEGGRDACWLVDRWMEIPSSSSSSSSSLGREEVDRAAAAADQRPHPHTINPHSKQRCRLLHLYRMGLASENSKSTKTYKNHSKRTARARVSWCGWVRVFFHR